MVAGRAGSLGPDPFSLRGGQKRGEGVKKWGNRTRKGEGGEKWTALEIKNLLGIRQLGGQFEREKEKKEVLSVLYPVM